MVRKLWPAVGLLALAVAGCQDNQFSASSTKHLTPVPAKTMALMSEKGMSKSDPILIRAYKKEAEMEVWKRGTDGRYAILKTFPICRWSGQLGPKVREGDRQAPEGFYSITPAQMNPNSSYYLSFDTGFPNAFDRANNRSGKYLMVHGTCSSMGCFAMTDEAVSEIYALARDSFGGGQRAFQFQSYPFRMTAENLAKFRHDPNMPFWKNLKEGSDYFEVNKDEPRVAVCGKRYGFGADESCGGAPEPAVAQRRESDERAVAELVAKGTPAVRLVYDDGGQHASFQEAMARIGADSRGGYSVSGLGQVSRPEAIAAGPREIPIEAPTMVAEAKPAKGTRPARPTALAFAPAEAPTADEPLVARAAKARPGAPAATTIVARRAPVAPEAAAAKPAPITVADAGDDPTIYRRVMGKLFGDAAPKPAPAPAADELVPAPASPPRRPVAKPAQQPVVAKPAPKPGPQAALAN